jgi:NAD(P)-dependent dehydrogenase (short-subunit alcohol dehydrogenase family)
MLQECSGAALGGMMPQVWLITGSSRGLGRAFAEAALASGCQVAATARNAEDLVELKDKYGDLVLPLSLNVTSETQAREAVQATIAGHSRWRYPSS